MRKKLIDAIATLKVLALIAADLEEPDGQMRLGQDPDATRYILKKVRAIVVELQAIELKLSRDSKAGR